MSDSGIRIGLVDTPVDGQLIKAPTSNWAYDHNASLIAHQGDPNLFWRTGEYFRPPPYFDNGTLLLVADRIFAHPFILPRGMTFDRMAISVTIEDAGKSAVLGLYNEGANLYPGTLLVKAGEVSVNGVAIVAATFSQALSKGVVYWLALSSEGGPTVRNSFAQVPLMGIQTAVFQGRNQVWRATHVYDSDLPDPFPGGGSLVASSSAPGVAMRLLSLD